MAKMVKAKPKAEFVLIPNKTATACQRDISLQALGLLVNLCSYSDTWELHKTELYKRFIKNKKTSVTSAWDELIAANYMIEFKYRNGKKWEYVYIYNDEPFTEEEREAQLAKYVEETGVSSASDFQQLKFNSSKCTVQNTHIINNNKRNTNKRNTNKKIVNKEIPFTDLMIVINDYYSEYAPSRWSKKQWNKIASTLANDLIDDDGIFRKAFDEFSYIRGCLDNIAHHHDSGTGKKEFVYEGTKIPLYNWLDS
jgi:hypothetical protein